MTTRIGYLIPEFPGQTHAFFMRERGELQKRGVETCLISTQPPVNGRANHAWADGAAAETTYLHPLTFGCLLSIAVELLRAGPIAWYRCVNNILRARDVTLKQKLKLFCFIPAGALLVSIARRQGWRHVHVHSCANAANVAMFAGLLSHLTYSMTLHGPLRDYGPNQRAKWRNAKFGVIITQELFSEVLTNLHHDIPPQLMLAPMGVDVSRFVRDDAYQAPTADCTIRMVACGRINPCKGHDTLIRVVQLLEERGIRAELHICGSTDSQRREYHNFLNQMIEENELTDRVQLLGSVSEDRVREELQAAHFFCLASLKEPLGVATMEGMAMGIPAIVTNSPGVAEMIEDGRDGVLVPPQDPETFADAIEDLVRNPQRASDIAVAGRNTIVERFHSGVSAEVIRRGVLGIPAPVRSAPESAESPAEVCV